MKRLLFAAVALLCSATLTFAQEQQAASDPKVLPMFGNQPKTEAQQKTDEKFLTSCDKSFANRAEASTFFMERGWEYYNESQIDTAMHRFNLAWLLNPDNSNAYWAFGLVTANRGNAQEAIPFYEKALKYEPKNSLLLSDIASSYLEVYKEKNKKKVLKKAVEYLNTAVAADSSNAYAFYNLARTKYFEKKYGESWDYLHKSRGINIALIDFGFLNELIAKMPDPQGFFNASTN